MLALYRFVTLIGEPLIHLLWWRRAIRGKEDRARRGERFGKASVARPQGVVCWVHAASVGEAISVLPLIQRLHEDDACPMPRR